jgi:hypothetical protein
MKKLVATVSGVAGALAATCLAFSPPAAAGPACPYDMSTQAGKAAFQQAIVASSQQVGQDQQAYGVNGNAALATNDTNIERNSSNIILACQGIASPPLPPLPVPPPPLPAGTDPDLAAIRALPSPKSVDIGGPLGIDCTGINNSYTSLGPVTDGVDVIGVMRKMPGLGDIDAATLATCGILNLGIGAVDPNSYNQDQAGIGLCKGAESLAPFDTAHNFICGTPAG